jgi:hypothetical protein
MPATDEMAVQFDVPVPPAESEALMGLHETPMFGLDALVERETVPENPFRLLRVTVKLYMPFELNGTLLGADRLKSTTWTMNEAEWETPPLVPVIVTV